MYFCQNHILESMKGLNRKNIANRLTVLHKTAIIILFLTTLFTNISAQEYVMSRQDSIMVHVSRARRAMIPALKNNDTVIVAQKLREIKSFNSEAKFVSFSNIELEQIELILTKYEQIITQITSKKRNQTKKTIYSRDKLDVGIFEYLVANIANIEKDIASSNLAPDEKYALKATINFYVFGTDFSEELRKKNLQFSTTYPNSKLKSYIKKRFPNIALPFTTSFHASAELPIYDGTFSNNFEKTGIASGFGIDFTLKRYYFNTEVQIGKLNVNQPFELEIGEEVEDINTTNHFNRLAIGIGVGYAVVMNDHVFIAPTLTIKKTSLQSNIYTDASGIQEIDLYNCVTYGAEIMAKARIMTFGRRFSKTYSFLSIMAKGGIEVPTKFEFIEFKGNVYTLGVGLVFGIGSR